jgi:GDP-4-dehydro-6-deoxy-D-mannose reductase
MNKKSAHSIIITGGNGFVGRHLIAELRKIWPKVSIVVWDTTLEGLPEGVEGVTVDITKPEMYKKSLEETKPTWIVHLAAVASVPFAIQHPEVAKHVNIEGTRALLSSVHSLSADTRVLIASSADIYGHGSPDPLPELSLSECTPQNPYSQSKWEMEQMVEKEFQDFTIRVRPFPHVGPGQGKGFVTADFASQVADIETGKQEPVLRVGNLAAKRDFTDVRDVVRAYRLVMEKGKIGEVYNIGSGRAIPVQTILDTLLTVATVDITVEQDPARMRPSDTPVLFGDTTKLVAATGWQPEIPFEQTMREILDYWRSKVRTS